MINIEQKIFFSFPQTGRLLQRADIGILFFFMLGVCVSTISQCFLISVFFNKANLAAVCGGFIYFILYLPYTQLVQWVGQAETWHFNLAVSIFSSTLMFLYSI